jgi:hypothetical protein
MGIHDLWSVLGFIPVKLGVSFSGPLGPLNGKPIFNIYSGHQHIFIDVVVFILKI